MTSPRFAPVSLVGAGPDLLDDIRAWVTSEPLRALIDEFGGDAELTESTATDVADALAQLDRFTDRWDTRNGRERNLAGELDLTAGQADLVLVLQG